MVKTLDKKVWREFVSLRSQGITIILVVASGIAVYLTSLSAYDSLKKARDSYYADYSLAQGFVSLNKAPRSVLSQVSQISGISYVEGRILKEVVLDFESESVPSAAKIVSLPENLNTLSIREGGFPKQKDEIIVSESFASANQFHTGSKIIAILEGRKRILTVTGIALSPEFVYVFRPGSFLPDDKHFGIVWMSREDAEDSLDMQGAINDIVFNFTPGADKKATLGELDSLLKPYGGLGSYDRDKLPSHSFLRDEFKQLRTTAYSMPLIFLGVAAFLMHIVATRIISKQREQIATLKAVGYDNLSIALHYLKIVSVICLIGSLLGIIFGAYLGTKMLRLYGEYYKFPKLPFYFDPILIVQALCIGLLSGAIGSLISVRKAISMQPAEAMRPPIPETFRKSLFEILWKNLPPIRRIALRNLVRRPGRTFLSVLGISSAVMTMVLGLFSRDTMNSILEIQFQRLQKDSVTLSFQNAVSSHAEREIAEKDGVLLTEGYRTVPIRIHFGSFRKELLLTGLPRNSELRKLASKTRTDIAPPGQGILLNASLASKMGVRKGDFVDLEILEGDRRTTSVEIVGTIDEILGQGAYMEKSAVNRLLSEGDSINQLALRTDSEKEESLLNELKNYPKISGISVRKRTLKIFYEIMSRSLLSTSLVILIFACVIAVGVVYNSALISLSERAFELGSLRILGFTKKEVFLILSGELVVEILLSVPIGCVLGYLFGYVLLGSVETEGFQIPLSISRKTYFYSILTVFITSAFSFWILYLKIKSMDLISVLKIRE
ncbi:ABC transporter permease [Leptospira wolffii]|uniref:ABC transporter permease n=1 Tax=Leptospira wolffii TaxID=409998 RepID=A0ABV5BPI8_9LEPT|nr:FtsX-like permease family protein [Leptospira wolffii]TGL47522.1 ABC transporter permease [Leptospira wolffii]